MSAGEQNSTDPTRAVLITPPGEGGIGIVRLQGSAAQPVLEECFRSRGHTDADFPEGKLAYGHITRDQEILDEVIVARTGPQQYEVNCHGGIAAVNSVLRHFTCHDHVQRETWKEVLSDQQSRVAPLSEESIRAAVMTHLSRVETRLGARMLLFQRSGALFNECKAILNNLADDDLTGFRDRIAAMQERAVLGHALLHPPRVLIAGAPNVGKSTLLNALLHRERVIVHETPGTTRDVVRETISLGGVPFEIIDSAGIRTDVGELETRAISKALNLVEECDILIWVEDATQTDFQSVDVPDVAGGKRTICVKNKTDLLKQPSEVASHPAEDVERDIPIIPASARESMGLDELEDELVSPFCPMIGSITDGAAVPFTSAMAQCFRQLATLTSDNPSRAACALREHMELPPSVT